MSTLEASTASAAAAPPETVDPALALLQQAMDAHDRRDFAAARPLYQRLLDEHPDHPDGLHLLGLLEWMVGDNARAITLISRALEILPDEAMYHNNLGLALAHAGRLDEAETHYKRSFELDETRLDAVNNLALVYWRRGRLDMAEGIFRAVLETAPGYTDARHNLAGLCLRQGRITDAVELCREGLITRPRHPLLRRVLGFGYTALGDREKALALYREWLADDPDDAEARHHVAALSGEDVPLRCSDDYVRTMFDTFASSFESKLAQLDYRAPEYVGQVVARELGEPQGALRVADAGCGTGLCAPFLAPYAQRLVGVDLSAPMLDRARVKGAYHELVQGDLTAFLQSRPAAFDVLVSADTLCYFGALEDFAAAARASLAPAGLLAFSVEAHGPEDDPAPWRLQGIGRYSHQREYVQRVLADAGFVDIAAAAAVLRNEACKPVHGWVVQARVAAAGARHVG